MNAANLKRGLLALLLASCPAAAFATASPDPLTACVTADTFKAKRAGRVQIVVDCSAAIDAGIADRDQHARALVSRSQAHWRLDHNARAEGDAEAALKLLPNDSDALLARGVARMDQDRVDQAITDFETVLKTQPKNKLALLYRGRARQWHKKDNAGARADYDAALAEDPNFVRALTQRASLLGATDPVAAERDIKRAIALSPGDSSPRLQLGGFYEGQNRTAEAMKLYEEIIQGEPDNPIALIYRSDLKRSLDDANGALRDAEQAIRIDPELAASHNARADALAQLDRAEEAVAAYREALRVEPENLAAMIGIGFLSRKTKQMDEGLKVLDAALQRSPKNTEALFNRALIWAAKDDAKRAVDDYTALLAIHPSAEAHYNRGQLFVAQKDHKAALADFRKAAELDPRDPDALNAMGIELGALGQGEEELKAYDAALRVAPGNTPAKINKAIYYAEHEDWARSAEAYRLALTEQPNRADLHLALGDNLLNLEREAEARKEYDLAIKLDPKAGDGWRARASLHQRAGRLRDAIADYGRALTLEPHNTELLVQRASVLNLNKQHALAMADLDAAVRIAPKSAYVLNNRGLAHANAGREEAALADYAQAISADADYEPAYYNRADIFIDQDRLDRAIRDLNVSLRLSPGDSMTLARKGYVYSLLKDYRRALEELDAALAVDTEYVQALTWRAEVKEALGDAEGAKADREKADRTKAGPKS